MARIYKKETKKGVSWGYVIYAGTDPVTGKDKRIYKQGFKTQKDAKLAAGIIENQLERGIYIQPTSMDFESVYKDWKRHYTTQAKESSVRAREKALKHIINDFGQAPIQKITKKAYQDTIDKLSDKFSYNYVSSIHSSANMVFEYAKDNKLIRESPTKGVKLPKKKETLEDLEKDSIKDKFLEKGELAEFLTVAKKRGLDGDLLSFTMLAYTGLRIGEMVALKWSDINFDDCTLEVRRTYYNPSNNKKAYKL